MGTKLIERGNTKVFTLTQAGETLFREGEQLLSKITATEHYIKMLSTGNGGSLRIQSRLYLNENWNRLLCNFSREHPNIDLRYFDVPGEPLIGGPLSGRADMTVAFDYEIWQHKDHINAIRLWEEEFVAVVSPFSPLAQQSSVTVAQLKQETLILGGVPEVGIYDKGPLNDVLSLFIGNSYAAMNNANMALQTALDKGFSIFPHSIAATYPMLKILPISDLCCPIICFLASAKENTNPTVSIFSDYVRKHFSPPNL